MRSNMRSFLREIFNAAHLIFNQKWIERELYNTIHMGNKLTQEFATGIKPMYKIKRGGTQMQV